MYTGMNRDDGTALSDISHIRQSVRDILLTPQGSRLARREYGSLMMRLIDAPQNPVTRLQVIAATYTALSRWEPRIQLDSVTLQTGSDGTLTVELTGQRSDGQALSLSVDTGVNYGGG